MKRRLAFLLVILVTMLSVSPALAAADNEMTFISPAYTKAVNTDISKWLESPYNRALATLLLTFDVCEANKEIKQDDIDYISHSYVGYNGSSMCVVMLYKNNSILYIGYTPLISFYTTLFTGDVTPENFDDVVNSIQGIEFEKNSELSFLSVLVDFKANEYGLK